MSAEPVRALVHDDGTPVTVLDVNSQPVALPSLWQTRTVIVVFVRHFLCIDCQDYFRAVWQQFALTDYAEKNIELVIIGCGSPKLGKSLAEDIGAYGSVNFNIYTDPNREAYQALGLVYGAQWGLGRCLTGTARALWQGLTKCWCICQSGDVKQNGGTFVIEAQTGRALFHHVDQKPDDHAAVSELLSAAGLSKVK